MENKVLEKIEKFKEVIILLLLSIWLTMPFLKLLMLTYKFEQYNYIKIVGVIGIFFLFFYIVKNCYKNENLKKFLKKILPILIFSVYMIWTLISCIFSPDRGRAFYGTTYRLDGYVTYLAYAGFFSLSFLLDSTKYKKRVLSFFVLFAVINCLIIVLSNNFYCMNIFWIKDYKNGVFLNSNHYGYYLLLATICANFLFVIEEKVYLKIGYLISYIILMYYLIINDTFGVYLAIGITLVIFFIYCLCSKKKRVISSISVIIFIVMSCVVCDNGRNIAFQNVSTLVNDVKKVASIITRSESEGDKKSDVEKAGSGRMALWVNGVKFFLQRPLLGYGPENLEAKYAEVNIDQDRPHNLIIQLATTSGLPGLILYLLAVRYYYKKSN